MHHSLIKVAAQSAILTASILGTAVAGLAAGFLETDLVANKSPLTDSNGISHTPAHVDPNLLNPWGLTASSTSPFWVSDNGAGVATLYDAAGVARSLVVSIPAPTIPATPLNNKGTPTGVVFNIAASNGAFPISGVDKNGKALMAAAQFLFATEDGTILGWNSNVFASGDPNTTPPSTHAIIAVPSSGAVYKGLAIATDALGTTRLYATNFRAGTVDVFTTNFAPATPPGAFTDPNLPRGYAPFNIVPIGSPSGLASAARFVVTYAVQNAEKHDDVAGMSHGIVNTFDLGGQSLHRLIQHGQLNSPWGVALAPASFGALANQLLIGNFGNGHINAYNLTTGEFVDKMRDPHGQAIVIDGLWSLRVGSNTTGSANFGPDTVFFTAGPRAHNEWHTDARCTGRLGLILPRSLPPAGYRMAGGRGAVWVQRTVQRVEERRPSRRQFANTPRLQGDGPCCGARVCRWPEAPVRCSAAIQPLSGVVGTCLRWRRLDANALTGRAAMSAIRYAFRG